MRFWDVPGRSIIQRPTERELASRQSIIRIARRSTMKDHFLATFCIGSFASSDSSSAPSPLILIPAKRLTALTNRPPFEGGERSGRQERGKTCKDGTRPSSSQILIRWPRNHDYASSEYFPKKGGSRQRRPSIDTVNVKGIVVDGDMDASPRDI